MRIIALLILLISVAVLPLAKSGEHASHTHAVQIQDIAEDHHEGHSHDFDDEEVAHDSSDHHHGDHTHEKAFVPVTMRDRPPAAVRQSYANRVDDRGQGRLYGIDRPPRRWSLA